MIEKDFELYLLTDEEWLKKKFKGDLEDLRTAFYHGVFGGMAVMQSIVKHMGTDQAARLVEQYKSELSEFLGKRDAE